VAWEAAQAEIHFVTPQGLRAGARPANTGWPLDERSCRARRSTAGGKPVPPSICPDYDPARDPDGANINGGKRQTNRLTEVSGARPASAVLLLQSERLTVLLAAA